MPTQRPRTRTGEVERVSAGQLSVTRTPQSPRPPNTRTPTRPRPTPAGWERRREQQKHLDRLLVAHRKVTDALAAGGNPRTRKRGGRGAVEGHPSSVRPGHRPQRQDQIPP
jgi:hypothetical protein